LSTIQITKNIVKNIEYEGSNNMYVIVFNKSYSIEYFLNRDLMILNYEDRTQTNIVFQVASVEIYDERLKMLFSIAEQLRRQETIIEYKAYICFIMQKINEEYTQLFA
jgi:hypothetical protein